MSKLSLTNSDIRRFWAKVQKGSEYVCWPWLAGTDKDGYGLFRVGVTQRANRVLWNLLHGEIPKGLHVLHSCDNKSCLNPAHLWLGTHQENMTDMVQKGRSNKPEGEKNGRALLTAEKVAQIRAAPKGWTQEALAQHFEVSRGAICHVLSGYTW